VKQLVIPFMALAIGFAAAIAGFQILRHMDARAPLSGPLMSVGEIQTVTGQVEHRLPRTIQFKPLTSPGPFHSQEWIATHRDSKAVLAFKSGVILQLNEESRLVTEIDASQPDAVIVTVPSGSVKLLSPGTPKKLRLFQDGQEITLGAEMQSAAAAATRPVITTTESSPSTDVGADVSASSGTASSSASEMASETTGPSIVATTVDEAASPVVEPSPRPTATPPRTLPLFKGSAAHQVEDTLSNDDINRQLKAQTSFFQRCYLTFINRNRGQQAGDAQAAGPRGTVTVGFTIQSNGHANSAQVVRSDFQDPILHKCLLDVIERTPFKSFNANAIPVREFPITLQ